MNEITNAERLAILEAARGCGFNYADEGKLSCTLDQLVVFAAAIAQVTVEQMLKTYENK
jgi:hypothetical protein